MKKALLSGIAALVAFAATPAAAQVIGAGGVSGNLGTYTNNGSVTHTTGNANESLTITLDRTLSGSSVSGFAGEINIGQIGCNCNIVSSALVSGVGTASTGILALSDLTGNGFVLSQSANAGLYSGLTSNNAEIRMNFANAGQSSFNSNLEIDYDASIDVDFQNLSWDVSGSGAGFGGFAVLAFEAP